MGYLISETTKEEREKIVADSLGNITVACDGCMAGLFSARYIKGGERPDRTGCSYQK